MQLPNPSQHESAQSLLSAITSYIEAAHEALAKKDMADLSGLDAVVDALCARVVALDAQEGRVFAEQLETLHARLDNLQQAMQQTQRAMKDELQELNTRQRASRAYRKESE